MGETESSLEFVSLREWPLVVVHVVAPLTDEQFTAYVTEMERIRARREPWAYLLDARVGRPLTTAQRRAYAESARRDQDLMREYLKAAAFVVPYAVHRGYLNAIHSIAPPPYPMKITSSVAQARAWIDEVWPPGDRHRSTP